MTVLQALAAGLIGIVVPTATAAPLPSASASATLKASPTPRPPFKTIITEKASPYCTALVDHFNSALVPMIANDRTFDVVGVQLDDMNDMFNHPDYINRFVTLRTKLIRETGVLNASLKPIVEQIDRLRAAATMSKDPVAVKQMQDAASALHDAYLHQFQLANDLSSLTRSMMQYDIFRGDHPLGGWSLQEQSMPADEKNIKSYLQYDKQRKSIDGSEDKAITIAYTIAQTHCAR